MICSDLDRALLVVYAVLWAGVLPTFGRLRAFAVNDARTWRLWTSEFRHSRTWRRFWKGLALGNVLPVAVLVLLLWLFDANGVWGVAAGAAWGILPVVYPRLLHAFLASNESIRSHYDMLEAEQVLRQWDDQWFERLVRSGQWSSLRWARLHQSASPVAEVNSRRSHLSAVVAVGVLPVVAGLLLTFLPSIWADSEDPGSVPMPNADSATTPESPLSTTTDPMRMTSITVEFEDQGPFVVTRPIGCHSEPGTQTDIDAEPALWLAFGVYMRWEDANGCPLRIDVVAHTRGADHCGFHEAEFLTLGRIPGEPFSSSEDSRRFVWNGGGVIPGLDPGEIVPRSSLPASAFDTGYRQAGAELWLNDESAFVVKSAMVRVFHFEPTAGLCE